MYTYYKRKSVNYFRQWSCLLNQPSEEGAIQIKETTLLTFTMDEQCRMEFGEG